MLLEGPCRGKTAAGHLSKHPAQLEKAAWGIQGMAVHKGVCLGLPTSACLMQGYSLCAPLGPWA